MTGSDPHLPAHRSNALPSTPLAEITGNENLMILVPGPGEESLRCGGLIAESCRRGRPPFVMVLGDGTRSHPNSAAYPPNRLANLHDRETRAAVQHLGLLNERLLMAGLYDGTIPGSGPVFEAVVRAVTLVMWARDCNVICAPWPQAGIAGQAETYAIAASVAAGSGVGLLAYATDDVAGAAAWRLDILPHLPAKRSALAAHSALRGEVITDDPAPCLFDPNSVADLAPYEVLVRPGH